MSSPETVGCSRLFAIADEVNVVFYLGGFTLTKQVKSPDSILDPIDFDRKAEYSRQELEFILAAKEYYGH